jgi:hypothetical protein|tara:strand:- start:1445 stop:2917 length:1473 start_codon:yes stop_codon:yes gene_type:complete
LDLLKHLSGIYIQPYDKSQANLMKKITQLALLSLQMLLLTSCDFFTDSTPKSYNSDAVISGQESELIFDYAYPLVLMQITQDLMFTVPFRDKSHPNQFIMFNELAKPKNQAVVLGNRNTLYCVGWVDLEKGPVVFEIPNMGKRYYVMPLLDAWTNTFASFGSRTTGQGAQKYLLVQKGWQGDAVEGYTTIEIPTSMVWITGRIQADSTEDALVAAKLQEKYVLKTLLEHKTGEDPYINYEPTYAAWQVRKPVPYTLKLNANDFYNEFFKAWITNPPSEADEAIIKLLQKAGVERHYTRSFESLTQPVIDQLTAGLHNKQISYLDAFYKGDAQTTPWIFNIQRMGTWGSDYARRAYWAMWGLGANLVEDAVYGVSQLDSDMQQMMGDQVYKLHFEANDLPPTSAFWSVTTYDNEGYLEKNELNRYSLGSNHDIEYNTDGSIDIFLSNKRPNNVSNWTPTPVAEFKVLLRIYWPGEEVLRGAWALPPIMKVE